MRILDWYSLLYINQSILLLVYRILLWWICIASKMFNDSPVSNRVYACLANIQLARFNELEMEVLRWLRYSALISLVEYRNYEDALGNFWRNRSEVLAQCYQDYKRDKAILKEIKESIKAHHVSSQRSKGDYFLLNNYHDPNIKEILGNRVVKGINSGYIELTEKFRFESYNSFAFKGKHLRIKKKRSWSVPLVGS